MKKEKELEYSRALVPLKKKFYQKVIMCFVVLLGIATLISGLSAWQKESQDIETGGNIEINQEFE